VISDVRRGVRSSLFWDFTQRCIGSLLPMLRNNLSVPSTRVRHFKSFFLGCLTLEDGTEVLVPKRR